MNCLAEKWKAVVNPEWYGTEFGQLFTRKIAVTAMNPEFCDKLEYLVNLLVNGPRLEHAEAKLLKFAEMVRKLSRPALEVLIHYRAAGWYLTDDSDDRHFREIVDVLGWDAELISSCFDELVAEGVFSRTMQLEENGYWLKKEFQSGVVQATHFMVEFVKFIESVEVESSPDGE